MKTAFFPGSFDPFTIGHASVVERALQLFDNVVIGIGVNDAKSYQQSAEERCQAIARLYNNNVRVKVMAYTGLTVDAVRESGADVIVKGVRSVADFEYEREQADINRMLSGIDTILILAKPELASVSSSLVRELQRRGEDVSQFLP